MTDMMKPRRSKLLVRADSQALVRLEEVSAAAASRIESEKSEVAETQSHVGEGKKAGGAGSMRPFCRHRRRPLVVEYPSGRALEVGTEVYCENAAACSVCPH